MKDINNKQSLVLIVCALGLFIDGYILYISSIAGPFIKQMYNPSTLVLGLIQALPLLGTAIGAIIVGRIADKIGRKKMLIINLIFFIVVSILCSVATSVESLALLRFLIGFGIGMDYPICASYLLEKAPKGQANKQLSWCMVLNTSAAPVGVLVAWIIFSVCPEISAWRWMLLSAAIPAIIALVLRLGLTESQVWVESRQKQLETGKIKTTVEAYKELFSKDSAKITIALSVAWFCHDFAYYGIGLFIPKILAAFHFAPSGDLLKSASSLIRNTLVFSSIVLFCALIIVAIVNKVKLIKLMNFGFITGFIALLCMGIFSNTSDHLWNCFVVIAGFTVFQLCARAQSVTTFLFPAKCYPTDIRATGHGLAAAMGKVGAFVGAILVPYLVKDFGIYIAVIILSIPSLVGYFTSKIVQKETADINHNKNYYYHTSKTKLV